MPKEQTEIFANGKSFNVRLANNAPFWNRLSSGKWEPQTFLIFDRFIDRKRSYIDIGAWIGPTLLYGGQLAESAYGVEPDPIAFAELTGNLSENPRLLERVHAFNLAIAPVSGKIAFGNQNEGGDTESSLLFAGAKTTWAVDALTFDDFIQRSGVEDCAFIKMDIEGGEYSILPTMLPWLRSHRPTLYLSLHPGLLVGIRGLRRVSGVDPISRGIRWAVSVATTLRVLCSLRFYRRFYDDRGHRLTPLRLLSICRSTLAVVVTDERW
jgi:FkbM family methyltransferase